MNSTDRNSTDEQMSVEAGLCRQPSCYRTFNGARGLNIHLGQSRRCSNWYKAQAQRPIQPIAQTFTTAVEGLPSSPLPWTSTLSNRDPSQLAPNVRLFKPVTVEEVDGEDNGGLGDVDGYSLDNAPASPHLTNYTECHPNAGKTFGKGRTVLQEIDDKDDAKTERENNVYYPLMSRQDFEMGAWLSQAKVSMSHINDFLKLEYVRSVLFFLTVHR